MSASWTWSVGMVCALIAACSSHVTADDHVRRHGDGVLSSEDFQATVPAQRNGLDAVVHTRLHYDYKYRYRSTRSKYSLTCEAATCSAEILPKRSWMRSFLDPRLVDHEQGHFDLAEITARRAQLHLTRLVKRRELRSSGPSLKKAEAALQQEIESALKEYNVELCEANREYDRRTDHGRIRKIQHRERRTHKEMLGKTTGNQHDAARSTDDGPRLDRRTTRPPLATKTQ